MGTLVDLRATPYDLSDDQLAWVEDTLAGMTDEEKVGQVFVNLFHFGADMFSGNTLSNAETPTAPTSPQAPRARPAATLRWRTTPGWCPHARRPRWASTSTSIPASTSCSTGATRS